MSEVQGKPELIEDEIPVLNEQQEENVSFEETKETVERKYAEMDISALLAELKTIVSSDEVESVRGSVDEIKIVFYKQQKAKFDAEKEEFIKNGGQAEEFVFSKESEETFKELFGQYKSKRDAVRKQKEEAQANNLKQRKALIEEISTLVNTEESLNKTFQVFHDIQERWKAIGEVAITERKKIWETYHHEVAKFYDFININKELRDLDLKKNLEAKIDLCEKAEQLTIETQVVKAFAKLQDLHEQWREIGPVQNDLKEEVWQRFKTATTKVNKAHQDYFSSLKEQEKINLESKTALCEQVEQMNELSIETQKDWKNKTADILEIQKLWKTIGVAPQKNNTQIYERFSAACDVFFNKKREFFAGINEVESENKEKKIELCLQAESMINRTDWAEATKEYIQIQKQWKTVGVVSQRDSNKLWNRFRAACDSFFKAKQEYFEGKQSELVENLDKKKELLKTIQAFTVSDDAKTNLQEIQKLQREWTEIGRVSGDGKEINGQYKKAIQNVFSQIEMSEDEKKSEMFKIKLEAIAQENGGKKLQEEQSKLQARIKVVKSEIDLLENNIGFFAKSKNSEKVIGDIQKKIQKGNDEIQKIKIQLKEIRKIQENL